MYLESVMSQSLQESLAKIKLIAQLHLDRTPQSFVDYSTRHSERIIEILKSLLVKLMQRQRTEDHTTLQPLNEHEIFVLLVAAYLHHIGIIEASESPTPLSPSELNSHSLIRDSVYNKNCPYKFGIPERYADDIADVVQGLAAEDISSTTYTSKIDGINTTVRIRLLSALLKIADSLDCTYQSIDFQKILASDTDLATRAKWAKYHFVEGLGISQGKIEINFRFPRNKFDEYQKLIPNLVITDLAKACNGLTDILSNYEVCVDLKNHKFLKRSVAELPTDIFDALECPSTDKPEDVVFPSGPEFKYDVAISYAGIHRKDAQKLAQRLKEKGLRVFFDRDQLALLSGENLLDELLKIYRDEAELCVLLASNDYNKSSFTRRERQASQDRELRDANYIFLVRMDDVSNIEGFVSTVAYVEWNDLGLDGIFTLIIERLKDRKAKRLGTSAGNQSDSKR